jgi:hypothetical protein
MKNEKLKMICLIGVWVCILPYWICQIFIPKNSNPLFYILIICILILFLIGLISSTIKEWGDR